MCARTVTLIIVKLAAFGHVSARRSATADEQVGTQSQFGRHSDGTIRSGGQCLTGPTSATSAKTALTLQACDGDARQLWRPLGGDAMLNKASGLCLNALPTGGSIWAYPGGSVEAGAAARPGSSSSPSPSPGATATKQAKSDPSGSAMPRGDLPGWKQVFTDDFTTNVPLGSFPGAVSSDWGGYDQARDTSRKGWYSPNQVVSIQNGMMNLHLHTANGTHLVAAPVAKIPRTGRSGGMLYGRYAVRFRSDPVPGYKTAWLLWPDSGDWPDGEIDFPEGSLNGQIMAHTHHVGDPQESTTDPTHAKYTSWHTAIIEWTPQSVSYILDRKVIGRETDKAYIPTTPMHWVLQTETELGDQPPSDQAQGNVQIDWVAVWARN
jgi:Glycosyl hydrolases family 16